MNIFKNHIKLNTPCLIKNFLTENFNENDVCDANEKSDVNVNSKYRKCGINSFLNYIKNIDAKFADYGCYNKSLNKLCCNNIFLDTLVKDNNYFFSHEKRFWIHKKGNLTRNHYDGNGVEVINISLQGKKRFYLGSPSRQFMMFPLSNLSLVQDLDDSNYDYILDVNPGDFLYIPSYWWHKVFTLEDDSININFNFYNKDHKLSEKQKNILALHRLSGSSWWHEDHIHKFANLDTVTIYTMINLLITEGLPILLLALFLGYYSSNYGDIGIICVLIILILTNESSQLKFLTYGYSTTIMYIVFPLFIFGSLIGINKHQLQNL